ncbi:MAG: hypothetical protein FJ317_06815, partial [SAR202 cluster bacterium]|nr:hypothetical protein [SAR202 cluster bacterium]
MAVTQWIKQNKNLILLFVSVAVLSWAFIIFHEAFHVIGFLLQGESVCVGLNHTASAQGAFYFLIGGLLGPAFTLVIAALAMTVHFFYTKWKTATFVIAVASVVPHFFWSTFIGTLLFVGGNLPQGDALILTLIAPNLEMAKTDAHVLAETLGRSLLIQPWSLVMLWLPLVF